MFKRRQQQTVIRGQDPNRAVNKLLTYGLLFFLFYTLVSHQSQPQLPHFSIVKENFTPIKLPPVARVENLDNGEINNYVINDSGLTLNGNNVITIHP